MLHRSRFLTGDWNEALGLRDATWLTPDAEEMDIGNWENGDARAIAILLDGRAQPTGIRRAGSHSTLLLMINAHHEPIDWLLPGVASGRHWTFRMDTAEPDRNEGQQLAFDSHYEVAGRSMVLVELVRDDAGHTCG